MRAHRSAYHFDVRVFLLLLVLLIALAAVATLQYRWIDQVSTAQKEHVRDAVDFASRHFSDELDHDVARVMRTFRDTGSGPFQLAERAGEDPLVGDIFIAHFTGVDSSTLLKLDREKVTFTRVDWSAAFSNAGSPPSIVLPVRPEPHMEPGLRAMLIVQLSEPFLRREIFPQLARRWFEGYDLVVKSGDRTVWRSAAWNGDGPESEYPLPFFHPAHPDERIVWRLLVRRHGAPLEHVIAAVRLHNMMISGAVLLLLAGSAIVLAVLLRRAERLRMQQLEFVAGITHELNTPLAVVTSAGQNLADGVVHDDAQVRRYGEAIVDESRRLSETVAQVLQFAGMEARRTSTRSEPVDVRAMVDEAVARCRWLAEERPVQIETEIADDLPAVEGDAPALTRAVQNLIANAIRHGGDGGVVRVRVARDDGGIAITVEDQGRGIAARDLPHLFEPFYRGRDAGSTRGSGLGLTIVQQIAEAHGGSVTVARRRERGAAFTLHLAAAHA